MWNQPAALGIMDTISAAAALNVLSRRRRLASVSSCGPGHSGRTLKQNHNEGTTAQAICVSKGYRSTQAAATNR